MLRLRQPLISLQRRTFAAAPGISSNHPAPPPVADATGTIIYTECDEAPALATFSLLPILQKFGSLSSTLIVPSDISLAGRILAHFPENLSDSQKVPDNLSQLGIMAKDPTANIVKLPNISASIPQLNECIYELRGKGFDVPLYPQEPTTDAEKAIHETYAKVLGSAVNPVLREGNSDRRAADPVKAYASKNPHKMGAWSKDCRSHVSHMTAGDFYESEKTAVTAKATSVRIELEGGGETRVMKKGIALEASEHIDGSRMSVEALKGFYESEITSANDDKIMLSLHLKATMMKISDPILFGHAVEVYFKDAFEKHKDTLLEIGANSNNGLGDVLQRVRNRCIYEKGKEILDDFEACYDSRPPLAMVDSNNGITNLHVPSDVIIDASMPVVVRDSGKMWNKDDALEDVKCIIPDRCYATMYKEVLDYCREHGQFDVTTMGHCPNVGLMAQKAQEYGSHPNTFEIPTPGTMRVVDESTNETYFSHEVSTGDVWRMCQTKDAPIRDWVRLAVERARSTSDKTIFWLDEKRSHDASLIEKVNTYLADHDTSGLDISIAPPVAAIRTTMERATAGQNTITVTGNVLRDYLTDLFPILELGTSAKMLSVVPLLAGGGLFETGAGGSAPKHVQQFQKEGHLRWDSLGEYLAMAVSFEHLAKQTDSERTKLLGENLTRAVGRVLDNRKSPKRGVNELDNRATNFYIALYWSEYMAESDDAYKQLYRELSENRSKIVQELASCQGDAMDLGGYYHFDGVKASKAMRPSSTLNKILETA